MALSIREWMAETPLDVKSKLDEFVSLAKARGVPYADIRYMVHGREEMGVKDGAVYKNDIAINDGFGVRVLEKGYWGFSSRPGLSTKSMVDALEDAIALAKAASITNGPALEFCGCAAEQGVYRSPVVRHPSDVSLEDKMALLYAADDAMAGVERISSRRSYLSFFYTDKWFLNTEGSYTEQSIVESGGGILAMAVGGGDAQIRAYPELMGDEVQGGWEFVETLGLAQNAERVAKEASALLDAPAVPPGEHDVIINGSQLALMVHESCGHPSELDRVMGVEADVAGMSFLTPDGLNRRRYGSSHVTLTADATIPGGLGSFGWDDEGIKAQRIVLVDKGVHTGYLTSRQYTVGGTPSGGNGRASEWWNPPIVRMSNINLLAGETSLEDIIRDTKHGYIFDGQKTWSIDDRRLNFAFGCQAAWEITDGKIGRLMKNPSYTGITPEVWGSCDAVADQSSWRVWGLTGCGKGAPMQNLHVGHGTSPARFRGLKVGVAK